MWKELFPIMRREKFDERNDWAEGRIVAIRPDVPGRFNAEDTIFLRTDEERKVGRQAIRDIMDEMARDGKPSWYEPKTTKQPGLVEERGQDNEDPGRAQHNDPAVQDHSNKRD